MYPATIIPMANTKHATNDNTSGTGSLVYFVIPNVYSLDSLTHPDGHPSVHDNIFDCEHIDEVQDQV
jgi:hypothetical protein